MVVVQQVVAENALVHAIAIDTEPPLAPFSQITLFSTVANWIRRPFPVVG